VIEWLALSTVPKGPMLLCVPFAGAGPSAYRDWPDELPGIEVRAAYLPGRERRFREQPSREIAALTADPQPLVELVEGRRYALFGHSFGALVAFELCRTARRHGLPAPEALLVAGCRAPDLPARQLTYDLPDDAFVRSLDDLGGTPPAVRANRELMELLLPTLRADFAAAQTYRFRAEPPLTTPITAFCGRDDPGVPVEDMTGWARHSHGEFDLLTLPGDHFFIAEHRTRIATAARAALFAPRPERRIETATSAPQHRAAGDRAGSAFPNSAREN
jgi:surfactin synthase thioesterase subunit